MDNDSCFTKMYNSYIENKMAQSFLIQTNNMDKCVTNLVKLIQKMLPQDNVNYENIINNYVPNIINIVPDGRDIKKEQIDDMKKKFVTSPIFGNYNIYIIQYAEKLNDSSANRMLKFIEEPEKNIIGFFICNDINKIISTIKSRCMIYYDIYESDANETDELYEEKFLKALEYITELENKDSNILLYNKVNYDKKAKDDIIELVNFMLFIYRSYLEFMTIKKVTDKRIIKTLQAKDKKEIVEKINLLIKKQELLENNVNIGLYLDSLVLEMRSISE